MRRQNGTHKGSWEENKSKEENERLKQREDEIIVCVPVYLDPPFG